MSNRLPQNNNDLSQNTEKLLESANSASQTVAALHVAFMAFAAYLGVILWGTRHEDLLRNNPIKLPILDVELTLATFYGFVPWLLFLLHVNLLMQLELLSRKLWNLDRHLPATRAGQQVRDRLFIFPFTHLIAGRSKISCLLSIMVGITIIIFPLFLLLAAQISFLPFHDEGITWIQRLAVWIDATMLLVLWPLISSPKDQWWESWCNLFRLFSYCLARCRYSVHNGWYQLARLSQRNWPRLCWCEFSPRHIPQTGTKAKGMFILLTSVLVSFLLSVVAVIPGSITVKTYYSPPKGVPNDLPYHFEDWLIRHAPEAWLSTVVSNGEYGDAHLCTSLVRTETSQFDWEQVALSSTCSLLGLWGVTRNLNLEEAKLVPKEVSLSLLTRAIDSNKLVRDTAFKEFDGLDLHDRDLRFANLFRAVLPKANLLHVQLQGANLDGAHLQNARMHRAELQNANLIGAQLQSAVLSMAQLQNAMLDSAQLQGAYLSNAQLQGAQLSHANLQDANLSKAQLSIANLSNAQLQGTNLNEAQLLGANLSEAQLQGANLNEAQLLGANLSQAQLPGANLKQAQLQGVDLTGAELQGSDLDGVDMQGANLSQAQLQGVDLSEANLQGSDLSRAKIQGVDWSRANLDGVLIIGSSKLDWSEHQQSKLEATLKLMLSKDIFASFQKHLVRARKGLPPGESASRTGCYSDNTALLHCKYRQPAQLDAYRTTVLHPKLIELACSHAAIAEGIARRGYARSRFYIPDFNLAAALLKELDSSKPCHGLATLPKEARKLLRETAERQEKETDLK